MNELIEAIKILLKVNPNQSFVVRKQDVFFIESNFIEYKINSEPVKSYPNHTKIHFTLKAT